MTKSEIRISTILDRFPEVLKLVNGEPLTTISGIQTPALAKDNELIFVSSNKHLEEARAGGAKAWIVQAALLPEIGTPPALLISSPNAYLAMAWIGKEFFPLKIAEVPVDGSSIHPTAIVAKSARLGRQVKIGPGAVISDGCDIGDEAVIGANSVLEPGVKIGSKTRIHPLVFIGHGCEVGAECDIKPNSTIGGEGFGFAHDQKGQHHRITHYGRVIVEDRVHIGAGVQIDRGTFDDSRIGEGTKIDNHCHFGHNIRIGKHTIIVGGTLIAGSVSVGSHCIFAGRISVTGHVDICDNVQLTAMAGVGKSIDKPGQYGGIPLQEYRDALKTRASLPMLPSLRKQVLRILKKLEMNEE